MCTKLTHAELTIEISGKLQEIHADFKVKPEQMTKALACVTGVAMKEEGLFIIDSKETMTIIEVCHYEYEAL